MDYAWYLLGLVGSKLVLCVAVAVFWQSTGQMFLAIPSVALVATYCIAIGSNRGGFDALPFVAGVALAAIIGLAFARIKPVLSGPLFLLAGLAFMEIIRRTLYIWFEATNGAYGITLPVPDGFSLPVWSFVVTVLALLVTWGVGRGLQTPTGVALRIVAQAPDRAAECGIHPARSVWIGGIATGALTGVGAAAYAVTVQFAHPESLGLADGLAALAVALAIRVRTFTRDTLLIGGAVLAGRELLRLAPLSGAERVAFDEALVATILIIVLMVRSVDRSQSAA